MEELALEPLIDSLRPLIAARTVIGDNAALDQGAEVVARLCRDAGLHATISHTEGAPIVVAHRKGASKRHLLFYNHYDVAPVGVRREWSHNPFTLAERDGRLYGRGVALDKANLVARLAAVKALIKEHGELPAHVSFIIEGDALQGSPHLPGLIADQANQLQADLVLGAGSGLDPNAVPYVYAGVRGRLAVLIRTQTAQVPLAGEFGVSVPNPAWRLLWTLGHIKNDSEEVLIDGFYDGVVPPGRESSSLVRSLQLDEVGRSEAWGLHEFLFGMTGATLARAEIFSPTCNVSMLQAGHGMLSTVPHYADAMIDFTLVPEQRPNEILRLLRNHLDERGFADVKLEPIAGAYPPALTSLASPAIAFLAQQIEAVYGRTPNVAPLAPFPQPLHLFTAGMSIPALPLGLDHARAITRGPNEWIDATTMQTMVKLIKQVITNFATFDRDLRL